MGNYKKSSTSEKRIIVRERSEPIDIDRMAQAVAKLVLENLPEPKERVERQVIIRENSSEIENPEFKFDNSESLKRLADSMVVQRGDNKSNFNELGKTQETKTNKTDMDNTIGLLKGLDD